MISAVVCDLDGTLLFPNRAEIPVPGRSGISFMARSTAILLARISRQFPLVIATGRNAASVINLVCQLPDVRFTGFVLENGFVVKKRIEDTVHHDPAWESLAARFPPWERLPGYENCLGLIPPVQDMDTAKDLAENLLKQLRFKGIVYRENRKIFVYPAQVNKMRGLTKLGIHPFIALGDEINDMEMIQEATWVAVPSSAATKIKRLAEARNGFCSSATSHKAAQEMLVFAIKKLHGKIDSL